MSPIALGIDVGSTTVKLVVLDPGGRILAHRYARANGKPRETLLETVRALDEFGGATVLAVGLTGSGGSAVARLVGGLHTNELVAQTRAVGVLHPEARTVIEIGGQDSKFLSVEWDAATEQMALTDFAMNALCAAGTGSFLDQQAERLGIAIDGEFARLALASHHPARIAGRCTVFAKSDMIHLQQEGCPLADILAGLCQALARNFRGVIGKGKRFTPPVLFQGGVARNGAVVRAFEVVLGLAPGELIVPEQCDVMAALGAAHVALDAHRQGRSHPFRGFGPLEAAVRAGGAGDGSLPPLAPRQRGTSCVYSFPAPDGEPTAVYLGVDVGSISTNLVLLDEKDRVVARRYLPTAGRPLDAVREGLEQIGEEIGSRLEVLGVGTTGSGRHLVGQYVGADVVRNEITAQARAAVALDPSVDTVFEIGGQDSKLIRIDNGVVVDFAMNNACAAGTGSFLEEQAERLHISIRDDFAPLALGAAAPACLGERCTVFMESDLVHHQQRGARVGDLTAGLAYSIVHNYLNRVVGSREVGDRILFLGGVAHNAAVASAFEMVLGRPVHVPPHHDVTGAIGAAILAREERASWNGQGTRFRGFDCTARRCESRSLVCRACPNLCEVKQVTIDDEPPAFYGARCDRFEGAAAQAHRGARTGSSVPDLFAERSRLLLGDYQDPGPRTSGRLRVGLPRVLSFHDLFPFWRAFFRSLEMDVVLSDPTNPALLRATAQHAAAETCFPVKLVFGHVLDLLDKGVDCVFLPSVLDREAPSPGQPHSHHCPLIPASSHMVRAHVDAASRGARFVTFPFHLRQRETRRQELRAAAAALGVSRRRVMAAAARGDEALASFAQAVRCLGDEALRDLSRERPGVVLVGRPYNTCDPAVCLDLPRKLRKLGATAIPLDCLPVREADLTDVHPDMYWRSGQDILGAARLVAGDERLQAIYLTSFHCGPDSFLLSYFRRLMGGKPYLELEVDDHTAEAGMLTRCEAFLDSLGARREVAA